MNKLLATSIVSLALIFGAQAQTNVTVPPITGGLEQIGALFGGQIPTNLTVGPFMTFSPTGKARIGGGIAALWNVSDNVGVGGAVDYIDGSFELFSAQVTLKVPVYPLAWTGHATNFFVQPFVAGGVGAALGSGTSGNSSAVIVSLIGLNVPLGHFWGGDWAVGGWYENLSGAGKYSGGRIGIVPIDVHF